MLVEYFFRFLDPFLRFSDYGSVSLQFSNSISLGFALYGFRTSTMLIIDLVKV